ncbi:MAG: 2-oxoglutarate dehydrogenase complex dihydrolipoyllysine-residue succinyltransferase [Bacteroidales bacterium]|nr:2-oxoglutarate dehydrogenase complex dihydrolipoyllysine-residue succinyltransferase [Bacteroidales bacterium]
MIEVKIPSPGESITEVEIADWLVENGDYVEKDQEIAEIESDKATLPLVAGESGTIEILAQEGDTIKVGETACRIDTSAQAQEKSEKEAASPDAGHQSKTQTPTPASDEEKSEAGETKDTTRQKSHESNDTNALAGKDYSGVAQEKEPHEKVAHEQVSHQQTSHEEEGSTDQQHAKATPVARKMMEEHDLSIDDVLKGLRRITKKDVSRAIEELNNGGDRGPATQQGSSIQKTRASREEDREKISRLRRKLSERLVSVKNETAMLTTFNEVDMSEVMALRKQYQKAFQEKHGIKLGLMPFFIKASALALQVYPNVNSMIDGDEVVYPRYADIGIAVQTPKGLMVPVIRNAESLSLAELEHQVKKFGEKGQSNRISIDEMQGGTFSITNGGVFGSLLSTPIINPPQSAILGMHTIQERPVAVDGKVEIRPMMYIALSYDHRTIDGKDSVSFLMKIRELIEQPRNMLLPHGNADRQLLGI